MKLLKSLTWLLVLMLAVGMVGCSDDDDDDDDNPTGPTTTDYFEDIFNLGDAYYTAGTKNITAANLFAEMNEELDADLFLIDWRSEEHFNTLGRIEGAVNWSITSLMDNISEIPDGAKVVNICYTGQTASQATAVMNILGIDAWNLKFGMCGWTSDEDVNLGKWANLQAGGQELETEANTPSGSYDYPVREYEGDSAVEAFEYFVDEYLSGGTHNISATDVYANLADGDDLNDPYIINYWPNEMYMNGHIPGAYQVRPITMDALAHIPDGAQVVVYCHTGQTSSQIVPWLNALGYDAYSLLFGMNSIDQEFEGLVTYHAPDTDYPVVTE